MEFKQKNLQERVYLTLKIDEKGLIKVKEVKRENEILKKNTIKILNLFLKLILNSIN